MTALTSVEFVLYFKTGELMDNNKPVTTGQNMLRSKRGQILPGIIITGAVLSILGFALLRLFQNETRLMVRSMDIVRKQELANTALEHARYKIQTGSYWYQLPLAGFLYDKEYIVKDLGSYSIYITEGNLFMNSGVRQGESTYRTIGIKVKVHPSQDTRIYYAVVKRVGYGGPLISKGKINLPCTNAAATSGLYNFYWGDIYSANSADDACRIPVVPVGRGTSSPQEWGPAVYAASSIYTATGKSGSVFSFGYTYDDMSPTARCHPYSNFAKAPSLSMSTYKQLAKEQGGYYGPPIIGGSGETNPYYIDSNHDLADITPAKIAAHLNDAERVFFIDTTDGLPVRMPGTASTPTNTYCGTTYTSSGTISVYSNCAYQYYTVGSLLVMGPLTLKGDNPETPISNCSNLVDQTKDPFSSGWPCKWASAPDNYYYPQDDDGAHFVIDNKGSMLSDLKHTGFLYVDGELRIGGPRCTYSSTCQNPEAPAPAMASAKSAPEMQKLPKIAMIKAAKAVVKTFDAFRPAPAYAAGSVMYLRNSQNTFTVGSDDLPAFVLSTTRGNGTYMAFKNTMAGTITPPTLASQFTLDSTLNQKISWVSYPLSAITLDTSVTFNIWASESHNQANGTITAELLRLDNSGAILSIIASVVLSRAELSTSLAAQNWTVAIGSTPLNNGDRLGLRLYIDDGNGVTLDTGRSITMSYNGPTSGISGDSYVMLNQFITEQVPSPTPTPTAAPATPTPEPNPSVSPTVITNCPTNSNTATNIAVYGTVFIGEHGQLTVDIANDPDAQFHFYYNEGANAFGFLQQNVIVTSFKELTYLVPTPMPYYPAF